MKPGTLYAVSGEAGWIYYGQVGANKRLAFFRRRDRSVADVKEILASPVMFVLFVAAPSITRALRSGQWRKIGHFPAGDDVMTPRNIVQWPSGETTVTVWDHDQTLYDTKVHDPYIQELEIMAVWDAEYHVPQRLTADFGQEPGEWHVGGPIWRERKIKEEIARRFPDAPGHRLPRDWVPVG
ncbi:hypothetical protein [Roseibium sp.]|uniref:hypothetical protein n=1 Tax=Roseibium sp. TaxID=1936156 RepID=UPI003A987DDE